MSQSRDGVVPDKMWPPGTTAYLPAGYQKWLESAGARVALIPYDASRDELSRLFKGINGLLIPGGDQELFFNNTFLEAADHLYKLAIDANDRGDHFPIWGTCMGMQLLPILTSRDDELLQRYVFDSENISLVLDFTPEIEDGRMFGRHTTPKHILRTFATEAMTTNYHHDGYDPREFLQNKRVREFYRLLATNHDLQGKPFVSAYEGRDYPFYGVQFHPETNQFSFGPDATVHTPSAIEAVQYLANFFVNEARRSKHAFASPREESASLIYQYTPVRQSVYFFPPNCCQWKPAGES